MEARTWPSNTSTFGITNNTKDTQPTTAHRITGLSLDQFKFFTIHCVWAPIHWRILDQSPISGPLSEVVSGLMMLVVSCEILTDFGSIVVDGSWLGVMDVLDIFEWVGQRPAIT